jgi:ribonuclease P/MRP protein subunit RPP40
MCINGKYSEWRDVPSGIPQGSILGPLLFVIYINDLPECINNSELFLFADDAKLYKYISCINDFNLLLLNYQSLYDWTDKWSMKLNFNKCKVMSIGRRSAVDFKYGCNIPGNGVIELEHVDSMNDLGVVFDCNLSFSAHIYEKINKAFQMLGIIKRNFNQLDKASFIMLYKSLVRSQLEYAHAVWSPYKSSLILDIEKVQMRATKMVSGCKSLTYIERLKFLRLPTLKFRRLRGDMLETFKILNGMYDPDLVPTFSMSTNIRTRGHTLKLEVERAKYDLRKYSFTSRVVSVWNTLSEDIVRAKSINSFKNKLDKHWMKEDMYYDIDSHIPGSNL